jgi:hypothetical protein
MWVEEFTRNHYYDTNVEVLGKTIHKDFCDFISKCKIKYDISVQALGVKLTNMKISGIEKGKHTYQGSTKIFNIPKLREYYSLNNFEEFDETDDEN